MSSFVILIIILGTVFGILTFFIVKSFISPRRIETLNELLKKKRYTQVVKTAKRLLVNDTHSIDLHYLLGMAYLGDGKAELALMELKKINQIGQFTNFCREIPFRKQIAELYVKFNQIDESLKEYLLLIKAQPEEAVYYYTAGELLEARGSGTKAVSFFMKAVELDKNFADAHYKLGLLLYLNKKPMEARNELEKVVKLEPDNYPAYFYLGKLLKENHDYAGALKALEKALKNAEFKGRALIERGICYMSMNNYDRAIPELERALKNVTDKTGNEYMYGGYFLAYCYEKLRKLDRAIEIWERIYAKKPGFKDVAEKLSQYQELSSDDRMKDYLTTQKEDFLDICRAAVKVMNLTVQDLSEIPNGCEITAVELNTKWRNARKMPKLIQFLRVSDVIDQSTVRNLHEKMKKKNLTRGIIVTSSNFSRTAAAYADIRPIDLLDKNRLAELLKKADL